MKAEASAGRSGAEFSSPIGANTASLDGVNEYRLEAYATLLFTAATRLCATATALGILQGQQLAEAPNSLDSVLSVLK